MNKKIIILLFTICIITTIALIAFRFTTKNRTIKNFNRNKVTFENAIEELKKEENNIRFERVGSVILISIYEQNRENVNVIKVKESEFYKYSKTIDLIKELGIEQIIKNNGNIDFLFKSSLKGGNSIVYLKDLEAYIHSGNKIREKKHITGEWYYVDTEGL